MKYKAAELKALWQNAKRGDPSGLKKLEAEVRETSEGWVWGLALVCMAGADFERAARTPNEGRAIWTLKDEMGWRHQMRQNELYRR